MKKKEIDYVKRMGIGFRRGVSRALERHKKLGEPIAVMRDGKVTIVQPENIKVPPYPDDSELEDC